MDSMTGFFVFLSVCLGAIVVVLVRIALWLKDTAGSLAQIAQGREATPAPAPALQAQATVDRIAGNVAAEPSEIAAILAVAYRHLKENQGAAS